MKNILIKLKEKLKGLSKVTITMLVTLMCVCTFGIVRATVSMDYENNQMTYQTGDSQELPIPVKDGYVFAGWWTKDGTGDDWGTQVTSIKATDMGDMNLYAKWDKAIEYLSLGGKVFYDDGDNGAEYVFYDSDKNEIIFTDIDDLDDAVYYSVEGTPTSDRFYVVAADSNQADYNSDYGANLGTNKYWGYYEIDTGATTNTIGSGKTNTVQILAITDTSDYNAAHGDTQSIWEWLNGVNTNEYGGCSDWFIGSSAEYDALRTSGQAGSLFDSEYLWSSVEYDSYYAYGWRYRYSKWDRVFKDNYNCVVAFRAF